MTYVMFAGGGTIGPVAPLIAVLRKMREIDPDLRFVWAGTDSGPERELIEREGVAFYTIPVAKLPRHLSRQLFTLPIDLLRAWKYSRLLLDAFHPRLVVSAGGFTAVPVVRTAVARRTQCISHQLDYDPGLSNRLIAKHSRYVTTSFPYRHPPFGASVVTYQVPTPTRYSIEDAPTREVSCRYFNFDHTKPVLLVVGGGTGALALNDAIGKIEGGLPSDLQIIHITGKGKKTRIVSERSGYVQKEFLTDEMLPAIIAADVVVSRAGVGAISEFAALQKPVIFIPLPDSPQEENVRALGDACLSVDQNIKDWHEKLSEQINQLINDEREQKRLGQELDKIFPTDQGEALANLALSVMV